MSYTVHPQLDESLRSEDLDKAMALMQSASERIARGYNEEVETWCRACLAEHLTPAELALPITEVACICAERKLIFTHVVPPPSGDRNPFYTFYVGNTFFDRLDPVPMSERYHGCDYFGDRVP